jgi:hypothetical protein
MPLNRQADRAVAALPENCEIYVDQTGEAGVQCLAEYGRLNARVHGFDYGRADAKAHLMSQLWQWIQQNKVQIHDQATIDQLIAFRFHLSSSGFSGIQVMPTIG